MAKKLKYGGNAGVRDSSDQSLMTVAQFWEFAFSTNIFCLFKRLQYYNEEKTSNITIRKKRSQL